MLLESSFHPSQHAVALIFGRFFHFYDLEASCQGRVFLEIFLVFGPGCGSDRAKLASSQRWLQQVGGIVLAGLASSADHRVSFINEKDDRGGRGVHFRDDIFQPILELALDARSGLQQSKVECADLYSLQRRRHIS